MNTDNLLRIEEVAMLVGTSSQTINNWYRWKKLNPGHELAKILPDYIQSCARGMRYWKKSDLWALSEFKSSIPHGRKGILGEVTQKARRKKHIEKAYEESRKETNNEQK